MDSILTSIKKLLGIDEEYTNFDTELIIFINSSFAILTQLGVGPSSGFSIAGSTETWNDFISDDMFELVKSYVYLKVRLMFDPPANSSITEVIRSQINEYEWRLNASFDGGAST